MFTLIVMPLSLREHTHCPLNPAVVCLDPENTMKLRFTLHSADIKFSLSALTALFFYITCSNQDVFVVFASTADDAPMYRSVQVQEPQHRDDFLRCECQLISLPLIPVFSSRSFQRLKLHLVLISSSVRPCG